MNKKELILKLNKINAIKFGEFKLKTGIISPIYIDLRVTISYPEVLKAVADEMSKIAKDLNYDLIAGVPYTALPIATVISMDLNKPMVMRRKEVKDYGTKKAIEGVYKKGQTCLIIEDLISSGSSVFETIEPLEHEGLKISDVIILLDREQGGKKRIENKGYKLHNIITMSDIITVLLEEGKIDDDTKEKVQQFLKDNQF
ncbi:orotate phosphoribosyltransferase [Patescibacteria group bacterium]|nr:orotate phosphoribosyltransferase [Patescibacteria group bacterium]